MKKMADGRRWILIGMIITLTTSWVLAETGNLLGAKEVLRQIQLRSEEQSATAFDRLKEQGRAFEQKRYIDNLDPEILAKEWLSMALGARSAFVEYDLNNSRWRWSSDSPLTVLVRTFPGMSSWNMMRQGVENDIQQQKDPPPYLTALSLFLAYLQNDQDRALTSWDVLKNREKTASRRQSYFSSVHSNLETVQGILNHKQMDVIKLEKLEKLLDAPLTDQKQSNLPDIVSYLGEDCTRELLIKAFHKEGFSFSVASGATYKLAQQVALGMIEELSSPCWNLVDSTPTGLILFEALLNQQIKQAQDLTDGKSQTDAGTSTVNLKDIAGRQANEILENIIRGCLKGENITGARQWLERCQGDAENVRQAMMSYKNLQKGISPRIAFEFIEQLWGEYPSVELLQVAGVIAPSIGKIDPVHEWLDQLEGSGRFNNPKQLIELRQIRVDLFLAVNHVEEATEVWRKNARLLKDSTEIPNKEALHLLAREMKRWYKVSVLLDRPEWRKEAIQACLLFLEKIGPTSEWEINMTDSLTHTMLKVGDESALEQLVLLEWKNLPKNKEWKRNELLIALIQVYGHTGQWDDIMLLLQDSSQWGKANDVKNISSHVYPWVAQALYHTGQKPEAMKMVRSETIENTSQDWSYRLWLEWENEDPALMGSLIPYLDWLYSKDAFEERPLIWKAKALQKRGLLSEAEASARLALQVDPTDGEQPADERAYAYEVLADILMEQGKLEESEIFRNVHQAVRVAEKGDQLAQVGLLTQSLLTYQEAEQYFPDAYCVQWRLAEKYSELNRAEEAQRHYELAFEQMPGQFGRVATFCFGCMDIFQSPEGANAAETVLPRLAADPSAIPQVFFLLGELREEQKRLAEAEAAYTRAVELDTNYLDAWSCLYEMKLARFAPWEELIETQQHLLVLDPWLRHNSLDGQSILDWQTFWEVRDHLLADMPPRVISYFPIGTQEKDPDQGNTLYSYYFGDGYPCSAGAKFLQTDLFEGVAESLFEP